MLLSNGRNLSFHFKSYIIIQNRFLPKCPVFKQDPYFQHISQERMPWLKKQRIYSLQASQRPGWGKVKKQNCQLLQIPLLTTVQIAREQQDYKYSS